MTKRLSNEWCYAEFRASRERGVAIPGLNFPPASHPEDLHVSIMSTLCRERNDERGEYCRPGHATAPLY